MSAAIGNNNNNDIEFIKPIAYLVAAKPLHIHMVEAFMIGVLNTSFKLLITVFWDIKADKPEHDPFLKFLYAAMIEIAAMCFTLGTSFWLVPIHPTLLLWAVVTSSFCIVSQIIECFRPEMNESQPSSLNSFLSNDLLSSLATTSGEYKLGLEEGKLEEGKLEEGKLEEDELEEDELEEDELGNDIPTLESKGQSDPLQTGRDTPDSKLAIPPDLLFLISPKNLD